MSCQPITLPDLPTCCLYPACTLAVPCLHVLPPPSLFPAAPCPHPAQWRPQGCTNKSLLQEEMILGDKMTPAEVRGWAETGRTLLLRVGVDNPDFSIKPGVRRMRRPLLVLVGRPYP